jgi:hypothetical protein
MTSMPRRIGPQLHGTTRQMPSRLLAGALGREIIFQPLAKEGSTNLLA